MSDFPECRSCGCPIFKQASEGRFYEVACACREELLTEEDELPAQWAADS